VGEAARNGCRTITRRRKALTTQGFNANTILHSKEQPDADVRRAHTPSAVMSILQIDDLVKKQTNPAREGWAWQNSHMALVRAVRM
jgi:hypothetical protein